MSDTILTPSDVSGFGSEEALAVSEEPVEPLSFRMFCHDLRKFLQGIVGPTETLEMALDAGNSELARESLGRIKINMSCIVEMLEPSNPSLIQDQGKTCG